jgi:DNA-binding MarR family transcriptional regulator
VSFFCSAVNRELEFSQMAKLNSQSALRGFQLTADSLKLYRRTDLRDPEVGDSLIEKLYVDPLPEDSVLRVALRPSTTFVIGRKGTGKSTIFERLQAELRKIKHQTSAYVDIKTVFESSQVDPTSLERISQISSALPQRQIERLLLYKEFLREIIKEIKQELRKRTEASLWERIKEKFTGNISDLFEGLDAILEEANEERFISALGIRTGEVHSAIAKSNEASTKASAGATISNSPALTAAAEATERTVRSANQDIKFDEVLLRTIDIKGLIVRLKELLQVLGIRNLYVLIDDFSELPLEAMQVVVDVLLAPLNNWSEEFVKFKIAAYPGRIYYGAIDKTKIDEIFLDLYTLYGGKDVSRMEESAIEFTRRLVLTRLQYFAPGANADDFFEGDHEEVWRNLFYSCVANPRILGNILHFGYESNLIHGKKIGVRALQEAAERYYVEKIESYFHLGKFMHESFGERASIFSLKELLEAIVTKARELRYHESEVIKKIPGRPPTSHFHVQVGYESILSTLELNFFLTKYFEMTDRSSRKVAVYALNYGLCTKYDIRFGRPKGEREFRLYFVERFFDYSSLVLAYLSKNQEITCSCGARFDYDELSAIQRFGMLCPSCKRGTVQVRNLSQKYAAEIDAVSRDLLLPPTELGILQTLHIEKQPMRPAAIAGELDCSYQLVGKRGKQLADHGLVERYQNEQGQRLLEISETAEELYFSQGPNDALDIHDAPEGNEN